MKTIGCLLYYMAALAVVGPVMVVGFILLMMALFIIAVFLPQMMLQVEQIRLRHRFRSMEEEIHTLEIAWAISRSEGTESVYRGPLPPSLPSRLAYLRREVGVVREQLAKLDAA